MICAGCFFLFNTWSVLDHSIPVLATSDRDAGVHRSRARPSAGPAEVPPLGPDAAWTDRSNAAPAVAPAIVGCAQPVAVLDLPVTSIENDPLLAGVLVHETPLAKWRPTTSRALQHPEYDNDDIARFSRITVVAFYNNAGVNRVLRCWSIETTESYKKNH